MKKVYVTPSAEMVEFQIADLTTTSTVTVEGAVARKFSAGLTTEGIGADNVVDFDFSKL
ncbi:MAG: hypothetical protein ACI4CT_08520 [Lachnospiraceae bacterium]